MIELDRVQPQLADDGDEAVDAPRLRVGSWRARSLQA